MRGIVRNRRRATFGAIFLLGGVTAFAVSSAERATVVARRATAAAAVTARASELTGVLEGWTRALAALPTEASDAPRFLDEALAGAPHFLGLFLEDETGRPVASAVRPASTDLASTDRPLEVGRPLADGDRVRALPLRGEAGRLTLFGLASPSDLLPPPPVGSAPFVLLTGTSGRGEPAALETGALRVAGSSTPSVFWPWVGLLCLVAAALSLGTGRPAPEARRPASPADDLDGSDHVTELQSAYEKLQEIGRQKDEFLSSVSHEFRTPLSSIRSFSEILLNYENEDPDTVKEFISIIHEESERLSRLVDDLLDLTKIESGRAEWRMTELALTDVIENALRNASSLARESNVALRLEAGDVPTVEGDRDRLVQVVTNLVSNALKFAPEGSRIDVKVLMDGERVRVDVDDEGPGVPEADREKIFEKFHQVHQPDGDGPRGTGLGLPISREIVSHLGGDLWVEPRRPTGSRFSFTLPTLVAAV